MIAFTYAISGILLAGSGYLFQQGALNARDMTIAWMVVFFFASAAASSAYLTVSETFPLEIRALAIAAFYAIGTGLGGVAGPFTDRRNLFWKAYSCWRVLRWLAELPKLRGGQRRKYRYCHIN